MTVDARLSSQGRNQRGVCLGKQGPLQCLVFVSLVICQQEHMSFSRPSTSHGFIIMTPSMLPTVTSDIKHPVMDDEKDETMFVRSPGRRHRPLAIAFGVVALCYFLWSAVLRSYAFHLPCHIQEAKLDAPVQILGDKPLIPLEAHIMSKCPDAKVGFTCQYLRTRI